MKIYGCIGKKLTHSFSREIHGRLADYDYQLIELDEQQLPGFLEQKAFAAINVTIPYKQVVIPYLDQISPIAREIGAVNTIVNRDGRLCGYNTDYHGLRALILRLGLELKGRKVLILGTGGTSKTARVVARDLGASQILTVSRTASGEQISYAQAAEDHADAQVIINTTPAGMYPDCGGRPMDIGGFDRLEGVVDVVYNPLCTNLVLDARARGIPAQGGLYMLVMQAVVAVEKFLDTTIDKAVADRVYAQVLSAKENVVLTGMPGSGKSTVGRLLELEGFSFVDTDAQIEKRCGCTIRQLIEEKGEGYFRDLETEVIREIAASSCQVIATGGGAILRPENVRSLKQNGKLYFLDADLKRLQATDSRPLSDTWDKLKGLYDQRIGIYRATADVTVPELDAAREAAYILKMREENL